MTGSNAAAAHPAGIGLAKQRNPDASPIEQEVVELFDQLRVPLLRHLLSSGIPVSDAEEIVQETFLIFFRNLREGKRSPNPPGWIFRTAHHFVLKHRERVRRRQTDAVDLELAALPDTNPRVDTALAEAEEQKSVMAAVQALPEQDRDCLNLRAEGLRYREIADALGVSLGSVANSLQRSVARLARVRKPLRER